MPKFSPAALGQVWRYYQVGVVNTVFGYGLYAALIGAGLQMYLAQIVGHIIAVAFNYLTYTRHVFAARPTSKLRFAAAYGVNYVVSLASLAGAAAVVSSAYAAGLLAIVVASLVNLVVLKRFVFVSTPKDISNAACG